MPLDTPLFDNSSLPEELDARVRSELDKDEQLLWVGQPQPGRFARQALPIVLFGIPWTAFSVFWMAAASGALFGGFGNGPGAFNGVQIAFCLFGLPFVLVGLGMLSSPYWLRRKASQTCYALTDRRAIVWEAGFFGRVEVRSYGPKDLTKIRRVEYRDGSGDLVFEEVVSLVTNSNRQTIRTTRRGFLAIPHVHAIEELLRKALPPPESSSSVRA